MRRHARAVGILGDVRREPAREPLQGERPAEGVADRLTGRLARDRLVRAAAAEAEVVRAGIAVLGALLPVGAARTGAASRRDRKITRLNSSHQIMSYAVVCFE